MKYGVQLYSLREYISKNGLEKALQMVSSCGYDGVEFYDFYNLKPQEIKECLDRNNLVAISFHISAWDVKKYSEYIELIKPEIIFDAWDDGRPIEEYIKVIKEAYKYLNSRSILFGHHNHFQEFDGEADRMWEMVTAVDNFKIELDVFWTEIAKKNTLCLMDKYSDSLYCLHIKEMGIDGRIGANPVVGSGLLPMSEIIKKANKMILKWLILEVNLFDIKEDLYLNKSLEFMKSASTKTKGNSSEETIKKVSLPKVKD